jgi:hypothetical protein
VGIPVIILGESLVDAVVEVLVVGEDDVAANIVELGWASTLAGKSGGRRESSGNLRNPRG